MPSRRSFLAVLAAGAVAGCTGPTADSTRAHAGATQDRTPTARNTKTVDTSTRTDARQTAADETPEPTDTSEDPEPRGPIRARNDVNVSIRFEEDDENTTLTESGQVRYVKSWRQTNFDPVDPQTELPDREPVYETVAWDEWAEIQARHAAAQKAAAYARTKLDVETGIGGGSSSGGPVDEPVAVVSTRTALDRDGEVAYEAPVSFEELLTTVPRNVEATYVLQDREYTSTQPIYARHEVTLPLSAGNAEGQPSIPSSRR